MKNPLHKRPWLLVWLAFALLVGAWVAIILVANSHPMEKIPVPKAGG